MRFPHVVTATGEWWTGVSGSDFTNWKKVDAPPVVSVFTSYFTQGRLWGVTTTGDVYSLTTTLNPTFTTVHKPGVTGVTKVLQPAGSNYVYALTTDGSLYYAATTPENAPFQPVMVAGTNPPVPLTNITDMPIENTEYTGSITVVADGKVYTVGSGATLVPGSTDAKQVVNRDGNIAVVGEDGSLWTGTSTGLTKQSGLPPLDSVVGRGGAGAVVKTQDGALLQFALGSASLQTADWTPTEFSVDDIVQVVSAMDSTSTAEIAVRLANGDVWTRRSTGGGWVQAKTPSPAQDISRGGTLGMIQSGDVACS